MAYFLQVKVFRRTTASFEVEIQHSSRALTSLQPTHVGLCRQVIPKTLKSLVASAKAKIAFAYDFRNAQALVKYEEYYE